MLLQLLTVRPAAVALAESTMNNDCILPQPQSLAIALC